MSDEEKIIKEIMNLINEKNMKKLSSYVKMSAINQLIFRI